jgi:hypothetical protein
MATIVPMPPQLCAMAKEAAAQGKAVSLGPDQVRHIAEIWHADREKIRYLESLLIKMARHAQ